MADVPTIIKHIPYISFHGW